jgi:hypothetical protein
MRTGSPPRTRINLEPYKDEMMARYEQGSTYEDLAVWLFNTHHVEVSSTKASQTMRLWGVRARQGTVIVYTDTKLVADADRWPGYEG